MDPPHKSIHKIAAGLHSLRNLGYLNATDPNDNFLEEIDQCTRKLNEARKRNALFPEFIQCLNDVAAKMIVAITHDDIVYSPDLLKIYDDLVSSAENICVFFSVKNTNTDSIKILSQTLIKYT